MKHLAAVAVLAVALAGCQFLPWPGSPAATSMPTTVTVPNVTGRVVAGPVCPVERIPPDPQCAPRPVAGASLVVADAAGRAVAIVASDAGGAFSMTLPPGDYTMTASPVSGLMGTPAPIAFSVVGAAPVQLTVEYDTGIR